MSAVAMYALAREALRSPEFGHLSLRHGFVFVMLACFSLGGVFLVHTALAALVNRGRLVVSGGSLIAEVGPLPVPWVERRLRVDVGEVAAVATIERGDARVGGGVSFPSYATVVRTTRGEAREIFATLDMSLDEARYIEAWLRARLGSPAGRAPRA